MAARCTAHLEGLARLKELDLDRTAVDDAGLAHLKNLTGLFSLSLNGTQVGDAGLLHLQGLTELGSIWLANTRSAMPDSCTHGDEAP